MSSRFLGIDSSAVTQRQTETTLGVCLTLLSIPYSLIQHEAIKKKTKPVETRQDKTRHTKTRRARSQLRQLERYEKRRPKLSRVREWNDTETNPNRSLTRTHQVYYRNHLSNGCSASFEPVTKSASATSSRRHPSPILAAGALTASSVVQVILIRVPLPKAEANRGQRGPLHQGLWMEAGKLLSVPTPPGMRPSH